MGEDRLLVDKALARLLAQEDRPGGSAIQRAMRYAVLGKGQRIRPILALRLARLLGVSNPLMLRAALSVELLHTASLIVDDLPCMDDAELRRGRRTVHKEFGEAAAVLAAFALVGASARILTEDGHSYKEQKELIAFQRHLLGVLDCSELIAGQALDLGLVESPGGIDPLTITELKTAPLFELAAHAGTLFSGISEIERAALLQFGREFGVVFQMVDDYVDGDLPAPEPAVRRVAGLRARLAPYGPAAGHLLELVDYLDARLSARV
jgi:geranylgeranyl diphosphate synthase type II